MIHAKAFLLGCLAGICLAAPAAGAEATADTIVLYRIRKGDTLYDLGGRYLLRSSDYVAVQRLNRIANPRGLPIGKSIRIPRALLRYEPIVARIAAFRGNVTVEGRDGTLTPRVGLEVAENYRLTTGRNGFVTVELPDGSRTTLPSQSRMRVHTLRRLLLTGAVERAFAIEQGRSATVVTPAASPNDRFIINTPLAVSAVRGTEFRVAHDETAARSTLEVIEGQVANGGTETGDLALVSPGFGTETTAAGVSGPMPLLGAPALKNPSRVQDEAEAQFEVAGPDGAVSYRATAAADAGFVDLLAETTATTPRLSLPGLPNGSYFVRFTAIDARGLEGLPATYAFERLLNDVDVSGPPAVLDGAGRRYLFKWRGEGEGQVLYRFVLSERLEGGYPTIDQPGLREASLVVTDLKPGTYYWRVQAVRFQNGRVFERWSPPQRFEIGG